MFTATSLRAMLGSLGCALGVCLVSCGGDDTSDGADTTNQFFDSEGGMLMRADENVYGSRPNGRATDRVRQRWAIATARRNLRPTSTCVHEAPRRHLDPRYGQAHLAI